MRLRMPFHKKHATSVVSATAKAHPSVNPCGNTDSEREGFTLLEVTIVLALTGLLLIGLLGGTAAAIQTQRYNDSVRSYAEYLRTIYSEVINPESLGAGNSSNKNVEGGGNYAIYGKVLVFGYNYGPGTDNEDDTRSVYSATLIGDANVPNITVNGFVNELAAVHAELFCGKRISGTEYNSTLSRYEPTWQAELMQVNDPNHEPPLSVNDRFKGTVIIARSPSSGAVHTIYTDQTYDLRDGCKSLSDSYAGQNLKHDLAEFSQNPNTASVKFVTEPVGFCVKSQNVSAGNYREVRIAEDGRNTSAISILNTDDQDQGRCR